MIVVKKIIALLILGGIGFAGYWGYEYSLQKKQDPTTHMVKPVKQKVPVLIYSTSSCRFCVLAKELLDKKGVTYAEIDVNSPEVAEKLRQTANGQSSVPQIFIDGKHIGGYSNLLDLEHSGKLDEMLLGQDLSQTPQKQ